MQAWLSVAAIAFATTSWAADTCNVDAGADVYSAKCALCHSVRVDQNGTVGPSLHGVVGRRPATAPQFNYSAALSALSDVWSTERLDWFLQDPPTRVPGTYMAFSGLRNDAARAAVICYLASLQGSTTSRTSNDTGSTKAIAPR